MKINKYIIALVFTTAFVGCKKDFLDKAPLDSVNTSNYYKTAEDAVNAVNAAYQPLQRPKLYNFRIWTTDIMAGNSITGAGGGTDGIETQDEQNFVTTSANAGVLDVYRGPAPGILQCNIVLQKVPAISMDETLKNRVLGEARFLRALYYFNLVRLFGDVPLITKPQVVGDDLKVKRAPKADVYALIIQDLTEAITALPAASSYSGADIGRASKGSATGLLAKVYLTLGDYQKTVDLCKQVTALGYSLNSNYADNFSATKKNTAESLFEVQYSGATTYGFFDDFNQASWTSTFTGPRNSDFVGGAYGWDQPTQEFVNDYESGDLRKDLTVLYPDCPAFDGKTYLASYSTTGFNLRKFLVPKSISPDYNTNPADFPVLRYADVLLMQAEAMNELGQAGAEAPLNLVRNRAGLASVAGGLSKDAFRTKVLHERRMELAFEGQRWFDLIRVSNGQYGLDFLHSIGKVNATAKFLLLPIPQQEIDANPNLTQNPGY
ncbi:Starch-binding associating with outer membrane [Mucilaginibacter gossypiicola]|uniref:Starch-binding associating with outer membrane n=1 Tax=Mucilaginibacter gossypiicola TaxID=551995 RepID=A0A1H8BK28_9SPHI|nr:RagB/SusD family nutrient uptake outer membrane protein [Mucilaginibacter gossypiicola]SEM83153.1 Starch-binding associating with outer membrane [Mucilaginibacter gossypiicola]